MPDGFCPKCDKKVNLAEDPDIGLHISCKACHAESVVVWLNPIELMLVDRGEYDQFNDDLIVDNIQKIRRKKGEKHGNGKIKKKHQENHQPKENR